MTHSNSFQLYSKTRAIVKWNQYFFPSNLSSGCHKDFSFVSAVNNFRKQFNNIILGCARVRECGINCSESWYIINGGGLHGRIAVGNERPKWVGAFRRRYIALRNIISVYVPQYNTQTATRTRTHRCTRSNNSARLRDFWSRVYFIALIQRRV